jgi:hypothetical protein
MLLNHIASDRATQSENVIQSSRLTQHSPGIFDGSRECGCSIEGREIETNGWMGPVSGVAPPGSVLSVGAARKAAGNSEEQLMPVVVWGNDLERD